MELLIGSILAGVTKSFTQLSLFNFGRICGYTFAGFFYLVHLGNLLI